MVSYTTCFSTTLDSKKKTQFSDGADELVGTMLRQGYIYVTPDPDPELPHYIE